VQALPDAQPIPFRGAKENAARGALAGLAGGTAARSPISADAASAADLGAGCAASSHSIASSADACTAATRISAPGAGALFVLPQLDTEREDAARSGGWLDWLAMRSNSVEGELPGGVNDGDGDEKAPCSSIFFKVFLSIALAMTGAAAAPELATKLRSGGSVRSPEDV